jgi:N-ethylmaleimide reductase
MSTSVLFTPTRLGALELPHRIVMAPLTRMRADERGVPTRKGMPRDSDT